MKRVREPHVEGKRTFNSVTDSEVFQEKEIPDGGLACGSLRSVSIDEIRKFFFGRRSDKIHHRMGLVSMR